MKKDTFWFPHDFNAAADPKMEALLSVHGAAGYGVLWRLIEMLHSEPTHKLPIKEYLLIALSKQLLLANKQISSIIEYAIYPAEIFESDGKFIWSARVDKNIQLRSDISIKRAESGSKGGKAKAKKVAIASSKLPNAISYLPKRSTGEDRTGQESCTSEVRGGESRNIFSEF